MILAAIHDLGRGVVPEPRGGVVQVDGRWLILAAVTTVAAVVWWVAL